MGQQAQNGGRRATLDSKKRRAAGRGNESSPERRFVTLLGTCSARARSPDGRQRGAGFAASFLCLELRHAIGNDTCARSYLEAAVLHD